MPSTSSKQARFMAAVAHGWKPGRVKAPPMKVAEEFNEADKAKGTLRDDVEAAMAKPKKFGK